MDVTGYIHIEGPIDYILHFASPASPKDYLELPIQTLKVGSLGTHTTLGLARAKKSVYLLASTSEVYGDPLVHPQKESYWGNVNPVGPRGVYDEAKRFAEALTVAYRNTHGIQTKIARIFNTYGPRMRLDDGRAIPAFMTQALANRPLTVFGDGSQTRSFCYIDDLIDGLGRLMRTPENVTGPINIGNSEEFSILQLASTVIDLTGSRSRIVHRARVQDDPRQRRPDISKAHEAMAWSPRTPLKEGLIRTIAYFEQLLTDRKLSDAVVHG